MRRLFKIGTFRNEKIATSTELQKQFCIHFPARNLPSQSVKEMTNVEYIWERAIQAFPILKRSLQESKCTDDDKKFVANELIRLDVSEEISETIMLNISYLLRHQIVPKFWKYFNVDNDMENGFYQFQLSVYELHQEFEKFKRILRDLQMLKLQPKSEQNQFNEFSDLLKFTLLSQLPTDFTKIVYSFYHISFKVFANSHQDNDDEMMDEVKCSGCDKESDSCRCQELVCAFNKTNQYLYNMQLLDRLAGYTLTNLIQERISTHVQDTCKGIFDISHIGSLLQWLDTIVLNWLTRIYNQGSLRVDSQNLRIRKVLKEFRIKLEYFLYDTYAHIIIEQFFNIIIDFPDSRPAIDDLKICLEKVDLRNFLIKSIKESLKKRLLHPGVNTTDILTGYVAAIKTIRHLDSSGVLLEMITKPVKQYMRSRQDTVRCVASALTEDGPTDLSEELAKSEAYAENQSVCQENWETWIPDPIDASPKPSSRTADIISMVVDIYGSKEVFVNEYRTLLADRLLNQLDFSPEKEIRNLELLKLRFDESLLHTCEVMLKDISDSKRINAHIHNDTNMETDAEGSKDSGFTLSSLILSSQFWPVFKNETLELPPELKSVFDKYTKSYETYKGNRTLCWRHVTGRVDLEVEIGNKTLNLSVSPIHAVILYEFQTQNSWHLEHLSQTIQVPQTTVRKRLAFWQAQGLIKEANTDYYVLVENFDNKAGDTEPHTQSHHHDCDDDEAESAMASASDQREEELQVFWSYIVGMLTNLDSLPLERIHQMLKMFASHGPGIEVSQEELKNFLQRKVREHALIFSAGVYQLPK